MTNRRTLTLLAASCLMLVVHITCGANPSTPTAPPASLAVSLQVSGNTLLKAPGQTSQLIATAAFQDGRLDVVTSRTRWTIGDQSIATISPDGLLTGVAYGRTDLLAEFQGQSSSLEVQVLPNGTFILTGNVTEEGLPIADATVSLKGGTVSGSRDTKADENGFYRFAGVSGSITVVASHPDYVSQSTTVRVSNDTVVDIQLVPVNPPATIVGRYRLKVTASPSCSALPASARTRTYDADLDQSGPSAFASLSGANFIETGGGYYYGPRLSDHFSGRVSNKHVTWELPHTGGGFYYRDSFAVAELIGEQYLTIEGIAETSVTASKISGMLDGSIKIYDAPPDRAQPTASCEAGDHRFTFTK
jgi:hypothetical protein